MEVNDIATANAVLSKPRKQFLLPFLLLLIISVVIGVMVWLGIKFLSVIKSDIAIAIITGFAAIFVSIISALLTKMMEKRAEIRKEQREKKIEAYNQALDMLMRIFSRNSEEFTPATHEEMVSFFHKFTRQLIPWGSDGVLKAFSDWKSHMVSLTGSDQGLKESMFQFEKILFEIRKDIGHSNHGLQRGDILRIFILDYDQHFK